jgi:type III restriction enzyme
MERHFWEEVGGYETKVNAGFTELKQSAYTVGAGELVRDYRFARENKSHTPKHLFGGFPHCLYSVEKFQSDPERRLAVILEREKAKWFKRRRSQFQLFYRSGADHSEYQPDFVAGTSKRIVMLEPKARNEMQDPHVLAEREVGIRWCQLATEYSRMTNGKPWSYASASSCLVLRALADVALHLSQRATTQLVSSASFGWRPPLCTEKRVAAGTNSG